MSENLMSLDEVFAELEARQRTWRYRLTRPFWWAWHNYNPRELRRKVRWGVQRWRRGYSDLDVWNADHHLARIIPPMMRQLSHELHGVPGTILAEYDGDVEVAVTEWRRIMETVAVGFESWMKINDEYPTGERLEELNRRWEEGSALLIKHFGAFWD